MSQIVQTARSISWRTPAIIILCGCLISLIGFGPRSAFGFFLTPMSQANGWGRDVFALAFAPFGVALIDGVGWQNALLVFGTLLLFIVPMALALATPPNTANHAGAAQSQSLTGALTEAFGHRSYVLLVFGFFTCGFQLAF